MKHKDVEYRIIETIDRHYWRWIVLFKDRGEKSGSASSKGSAIFRAVQAIDRATTIKAFG
jgi:hypothetical protein